MKAADKKKPNTLVFGKKVIKGYKDKHVVMAVSGALMRRSKDLIIPSNDSLVFLQSYSFELNLLEMIWNTLRRDYISNNLFGNPRRSYGEADLALREMKRYKRTIKDGQIFRILIPSQM